MPKPLSYPLRSSELISSQWGRWSEDGPGHPGLGKNAIAEGIRNDVAETIKNTMLGTIEEDEDIDTNIHVFRLSSSSSKPPSTRGVSASVIGDHVPSSPPETLDTRAEEPIRGRISHDNTIVQL